MKLAPLLSNICIATSTLIIVAQPAWAEIAQVTDVRLNPTDKGLEIILETADGNTPRVFPVSYKETFVVNITNTQLRLPSSQDFRANNPAPGIAAVTVTQQTANSVRVTVVGTAGVPKAEVGRSDHALVLSLTAPADTTAQKPQPTPIVPQAEQPESQTQPPAETEQPVESTEGEEIEIVVTGEQEEGYSVPDASTATRTDTPLREIPANVQVIPREVLEDQQAIRLQDALRNVSGVNFSSSFGNRFSFFNARGFTLAQLRNGFRDDFNASRAAAELANIERIEVLKGPASVLYGQVEPGGIINLVTKRPLPDPYYAADFTIGSYSFYRPTLDFSGPLTTDGTLAYRLNVAYENAGSFRDFVDSERIFVAPTLSWQLGPNTTLTLEGTYLHDERPLDLGLVAIGDRPADLPFSRSLFGPQRPGLEFDEKQGFIYLEHRFNEDLSLRSAFRVTSSFEGRDAIIAADEVQSDDRTLPLRISDFDQYYDTYTLQNDLIGKFQTGSVDHTVLFGVELARLTGRFPEGANAYGAEIDIFNPVYEFSFDPLEFSSGGYSETNSIGIYLQDQITLLDNLKLLIGGRFDSADSEETFIDSGTTTSEASAFSPRLGIVYQPISPVSLYANYSRSFVPQVGRSADNTPFDPERGTQYEVGVKADLLDGRLSTTLAAYQITKSNVLTTDPTNPEFSIQVGEQRSRGIELDVVGEILPGWNIIASYAYTDAKITEDYTYEVGNRLNNVPENTASLWTTYTIQSGSLAGLGFGAGAFFVDNRAGDLDNSFELPDYTRVDAAIYYTRDNFKAALNIKNLFDIRYFEGGDSRTTIVPGVPLTILGTVSLEF